MLNVLGNGGFSSGPLSHKMFAIGLVKSLILTNFQTLSFPSLPPISSPSISIRSVEIDSTEIIFWTSDGYVSRS